MIGDFMVGPYLGSGPTGTVFKGIYTQTNHPVAIKQIPKSIHLSSEEIAYCGVTNFPFIAPIFQVLESETYFYVIREFVDGITLHDLINQQKGPIDEQLAKHILSELLSCLIYLHSTLKIYHGNLTLDNILIDKSLNIHVLGINIRRRKSDDLRKYTQQEYLSPEIIKTGKASFATDIWSFGVIAYALFHKVLPFADQNPNDLHFKILNSEPFYSTCFSKEINMLISLCLTKNSEQRPTTFDLLQNPWFISYDNSFIFTEQLRRDQDWFINNKDLLYIQIIKRARIVYEMSNLARAVGTIKEFVPTVIPKQNSHRLILKFSLKKPNIHTSASRPFLPKPLSCPLYNSTNL